MGDFDPAFVHDLSVQSWSLYSVGIFLILFRIYARIHRLGFKGLMLDDYLMLVAGGLYTTLIVCLNVISGNGGSNLYPPEDFDTFSPENIQQRIKGSKIVVVSEQAMLNVIYVMKTCMLLMYSRLTLGLQVQRMVSYLAIYVTIGWLATEIAFFTACRPFYGYWAMPPPNPQCTTLEQYAIVQGCFNITSDTLMLLIPLPLILKLNVPLRQKAVLFLIFSMGVFVILAAILTKVFNLSNIWDPSYMLWYTRESSVAVYVSNLPMIWPLLREWFPFIRNLGPKQTPSNTYDPHGTARSRSRGMNGTNVRKSTMGKSVIITTVKGSGESTEELSNGRGTEMGTLSVDRSDSWDKESRERPTTSNGYASRNEDWSALASEGGITKTTTVHISEVKLVDATRSLGRSTVIHAGDLEKGNQGHGVGFEWVERDHR